MVGHHGAFFGKPLHVLGLFLEEAQGDEDGKIGVAHPDGLEPVVDDAGDIFPQGIAPGLMTMQPRTGEFSAMSLALITCWYHSG